MYVRACVCIELFHRPGGGLARHMFPHASEANKCVRAGCVWMGGVRRGAKVDLEGAEQLTAVQIAAKENNTECLKLLLNAKGSPNPPHGINPLVRPRRDPCACIAHILSIRLIGNVWERTHCID